MDMIISADNDLALQEEKQKMLIICRETDKLTGKVAVYLIKETVTDQLIHRLGIRQRVNGELRYFAVTEVQWENCECKITAALRRRNMSEAQTVRLGIAPIA
jgi:hypothetical protein